MARLFVFCFLCVWGGHVSFASDENPDHLRIPDEFEAIGGHALGLGHGGMAAISGLSSIRANPAMLAMTKQYSVVGGYHWPTYGRNFYQVGVVDSNTSNLAAGLIYNGFMDGPEDSFEGLDRQFDSPVKSRISLGFAGTSQLLAFGVSGSFVTAVSTEGSELKETKGLTLGLGVVGLLTPAIRFGLSAENLNNKEVAFVAPRTYRAALAYTLERVTLHLDWKRRDRVDGFELEPELSYFSLAGPGNQAPDLKNFEDLATVPIFFL